ncbi:Uncharacterized protein APZ42_016256 [Daphnia magna]|uniref:Uncharacterized protein n=1 Tax=Daphnia magna TaxID=35525 RepID=A0A165AIP1_9CRUS|nr:Uncharacterized protein APZ42_016256 [Daphnia magna]
MSSCDPWDESIMSSWVQSVPSNVTKSSRHSTSFWSSSVKLISSITRPSDSAIIEMNTREEIRDLNFLFLEQFFPYSLPTSTTAKDRLKYRPKFHSIT